MIEKNRAGRAGDCRVQIGILEYDVRRLASEFERNFLQISGGRVDNQLAHFRRSGECNFVDQIVRRQSRARRLAVSRDDVDHAIREPGFHNQLAQTQRGERRLLGRLQHYCHPEASAGASFHAAINSGKFHGIIWPTTPTGSRSV